VSQKENSNRKTTKEKEMIYNDIEADVREIVNDLNIEWDDLPEVLAQFFYKRLTAEVTDREDLVEMMMDLYYASAADMKLHPALLALKNKEYSTAYHFLQSIRK
jgi:uncharacterized circularly permuted ATP-grasp superfamily protein